MTKKYRIGVDVGGTNVKVALVDKEGSIVFTDTVPTRAEMGYEYTISNMIKAISDVMKEAKVTTEVIEGKNSKVWDQAENRKHTIKAIMLALM